MIGHLLGSSLLGWRGGDWCVPQGLLSCLPLPADCCVGVADYCVCITEGCSQSLGCPHC